MDSQELVDRYSAHNYHPLPVVLTHGEGAWVTDEEGKRYLDLLSAYSALNFGHRHPRLIEAAKRQMDRLTLTSRAFHNDQFGPFAQALADLSGMEMVLPMNSGAEAVETAIKTARKWGYRVKGVEPDTARIIVADGNFHGRTTTIISFSTDPEARDDFGPYTPGFDIIAYGDVDALRDAITASTVAFIVEPIQGEAGVLIPPPGYLTAARDLCAEHGVLFIADEIQSGMARTGKTFACEWEGVVPDMYIMGKALGGGIYPVSAVAASREILGVFRPGEHGSTFGGNPLGAAIGREVIAMLQTGEFQERSRTLGEHMMGRLRTEAPATVREVRGRGLWAGVEMYPGGESARARCEKLMVDGVLAKDTHETTIRLAPPIVIEKSDLDLAIDKLLKVLT
ncbi:MAG TPA: ornithine--oxo-acid transaminase [Actinomycetes bacterium]|nr:ornithine--oxo-acid transaminase [Actinomycetes bacterium]